jgi:hypothetical protein
MKKSLLLTLALTPILAIACSKPAVASDNFPVDVTLAYESNDVTEDKLDALRAEIGTVTQNTKGNINFAYGITTLTSKDKLQSFGAYAGIPISVKGTKLTVEPRIAVEHFRDMEEMVGSVGLGAQYAVDDTTRLNLRAMYSETFDSKYKDELNGNSYMVGLTKRF